jgi:MFS family permease
MALGILEDRRDPCPTGTTLLTSGEKGRRASATSVVLAPHPSTSPRDPLNWSRVRKELAFLTIILGACAAGVIGPLLVPGFPIIAAAFQITLTQVTLLNGALVSSRSAIGLAKRTHEQSLDHGPWSELVFVFRHCQNDWQKAGVHHHHPNARCYELLGCCGKELYLTSCCARVSRRVPKNPLSKIPLKKFTDKIPGLGMGGWFALAGTDSINDMYFVHQRGRRVGLWNFAVIVSVNVAPIISGYVITDLSWRWSFWILAIFFVFVLVWVILAFPETTFYRPTSDDHVRRDSVVNGPGAGESGDACLDTQKDAKIDPVVEESKPPTEVGESQPHLSFWRGVWSINGFEFQGISHILPELIEPVLLLRHPAVLWACAMWSVTFTWVIIQGAVASQIFAAPPYNLSPTAVGNLIGVAPLIGSALGTIAGGWACDALSKLLSVRNKGVYEPEFRLLIMLPFLILLAVGGFGLGAAISKGARVITCGVFLAILNCAVGVGCTGIVAYSNDACQHKASGAFGIAMVSSVSHILPLVSKT